MSENINPKGRVIPIGGVFPYEGKKLVCKEGDGLFSDCDKCFFRNLQCIDLRCLGELRPDGKDVYFVVDLGGEK